MKLLIILITIIIAELSHAESKSLIQVKVSFMEALAPKDTTSSDRFQKEYEFAVQSGKDLTREKLKNCGYEIIDDKILYDASDNLQALEQAKKSAASGAWLIIGPRRSNHYLLAVKGAPDTPSVSIMASAKEIFELDTLHLSLAQPNKKMAEALVKETKNKFKKNAKYISVVSEDCVTCIDLAESFDQLAKSNTIQKIYELKFTGEQPDLSSLETIVKLKKPDFILLPNYSMVSAYAMGVISKWAPKIYFIGGDGWGDAKYGFIHNSPQLANINGLTVKGFPPTNKGLEFFPLGREILKNPSLAAAFPASGSAQALLKAMEDTSNFLCKFKPKDKTEFAQVFKKSGSQYFKNPWGVSVFKLSQGEIVFDKTVK